MSERLGEWMQTFSGIAFFPFDPRSEEVNLEDIAHALSLQNRFSGATRVPYSVAEHSVRVALEYSRRHPKAHPSELLGALLHDAAEAYLVDLPRPIKHAPDMHAYTEMEYVIQGAIAAAFGIEPRLLDTDEVKRIDNVLLATEARDLMAAEALPWGLTEPPLSLEIEPWSWHAAKGEFMFLAETIIGQVRAA